MNQRSTAECCGVARALLERASSTLERLRAPSSENTQSVCYWQPNQDVAQRLVQAARVKIASGNCTDAALDAVAAQCAARYLEGCQVGAHDWGEYVGAGTEAGADGDIEESLFDFLESDESDENLGRFDLKHTLSRLPKWTPYAVAGGGLLIILGSLGYKFRREIVGAAEKLAGSLGIELKALRAVQAVEAGGKPFGRDGRLLIRFEPHVFKRYTGTEILLPGMSAATSSEGYKRRGGQANEYVALESARAINEEAAYKSISMGLGQVMGFNHSILGFPTAKAMFEAFSQSKEAQKVGMVKFLQNASPKLIPALKNQDWATFARIYNGDKTGRYAGLLAKAYAKAKA